MSRVQPHNVDRDMRYEMMGNFYDIVSHLKTKKDVAQFFMGLFTPGEALMIARRIQIAKMLEQGMSYDEISTKLGAGVATVAGVSRWLDGENEGFRQEIEAHLSREKKWKGSRKKKYRNILSPYGQLRIVKDLLDM